MIKEHIVSMLDIGNGYIVLINDQKKGTLSDNSPTFNGWIFLDDNDEDEIITNSFLQEVAEEVLVKYLSEPHEICLLYTSPSPRD